MKSASRRFAIRSAVLLLGGYIALQGWESLQSGRLAYWNVARRLVLYPETQISVGIILMLLAVLPLGGFINSVTRPYLKSRKAEVHPFWKRRRHPQVEQD